MFKRRKISKTNDEKNVKKRRTNNIDNKYTIDNCRYKSKSLLELHKELKNYLQQDKLIKSFSLPTLNANLHTSKYGSMKAEIDGHIFDSIMEAKYYIYLLKLKKEKQIKNFEMQVVYELQEKYKDKITNKWIRAITYISDFVVIDNNDKKTVIDIKGRETTEFKIKKKLFGFKYKDLPLICVQWEPKRQIWMNLDDLKKETRQKKKIEKSVRRVI